MNMKTAKIIRRNDPFKLTDGDKQAKIRKQGFTPSIGIFLYPPGSSG
jgi:hypothetical protein